MKSLLSLCVVGVLMATPAFGDGPPPAPTADPVADGGTIELFQCVKYKDLKNIHPCAVSRVVMVPDPCACCDPCGCCKPACVAIEICVPPSDCCNPCEKHSCSRDGRRQKYDFGKYEVEISVKKGIVIVDYDD